MNTFRKRVENDWVFLIINIKVIKSEEKKHALSRSARFLVQRN